MKRNWIFAGVVVLYLVMFSASGYSNPPIDITAPMSPPGWALMEQALLRANSEAVEAFAATYLDERGYLLHTPRWGTLDGTDDAIETFADWTLIHALGASNRVLELFKKGLEGHLRQYKELKTFTTEIAKNGAYYKEFMPMSDWHHNGEGMQGFLFQGLSDPTDVIFQKRMKRFAGFYMNEDPDAPNYDPEHKIIKSIWNGSKGPMLRHATQQDWVGDPMEGRFHILHSSGGRNETYDFMESYPEMLAHCAEYLNSVGDHPLNLIATILHLNAYMLGHEQKYKGWLLEYVDAWKARTEATGGNIPTNIGLDGAIGGEFGGRWYKGTYGWNFSPWSPEFKEVAHRNLFDKGMWPGFSNAFLVTGDQKYIDVLRKQMDNMYAQKKIVDGKLMIPNNYGDNGWYNWTTELYIPRLIEIYMWSMNRKDLDRIPMQGWIAFLEGQNSDFPEKALRSDFSFLRNRMEGMRNDPTSPDTRLADWAMGFDPVTTHNLVQLMCGGYLTGRIWIFHTRLRYFDPANRRAGIPQDVGALITKMDETMAEVTLVNVNQTEPREVIIQTGGYGEHQCLYVELENRMVQVNNRFFTVKLAPGAGITMKVYVQRYANQPTLAFPWHGDTVP